MKIYDMDLDQLNKDEYTSLLYTLTNYYTVLFGEEVIIEITKYHEIGE